ncbi:MAG TPA: nitrite/sulfite reductase [Acidimicrobiales bacterium]|jgi:sulfite reductase beta subunit-like hemoprotein|nr:nitrite/sulfite reductase [Acidimicrobiales bacterium]
MSQTIPVEVGPGAIPPDALADIEKFERLLTQYLAGELEEDRFRIFRLNNGIYGQRQGGHNQMVRVKVPYGSIQPHQLDLLADIADRYSRGWGHITTRQNIQFHFVQLERIPDLLREIAAAGLTTREACGDTVRNVTGCHLAGACPFEVLDISPWAEATYRYFLRHPYAQRLPRKFKINFSGCMTDCGQAMFNDVGVVAVNRPRPDGTLEPGFRVFIAGGLGANPRAAQALEEFTPREELLVTIEAALRTFDHYGFRDNKLRARMKWLQDTMGWEELQQRILKERKLLIASVTWRHGIPEQVQVDGDAPAGLANDVDATPMGWGTPVTLKRSNPYDRWEDANVVRGVAKKTVSAYAWCRLGDVTSDQFRALAQIQRDFDADVRVTNRQNVVFRGLTEEQLPVLYQRLDAIGMAQPGAELVRDVVSCPGADTCNLAVTQSRGLADDIGRALDDAGLAEVGGVRINISGCTNSCGQHHVADIGFFGAERRAHGRSAPGYQMLLGGHLGQTQVEFGAKALRLPAKSASAAAVRVVGKFAEERSAGETFTEWLERVGGAKSVAGDLGDLAEFPTPEERPDFYVDYDETGPYEAIVGEGECAGS